MVKTEETDAQALKAFMDVTKGYTKDEVEVYLESTLREMFEVMSIHKEWHNLCREHFGMPARVFFSQYIPYAHIDLPDELANQEPYARGKLCMNGEVVTIETDLKGLDTLILAMDRHREEQDTVDGTWYVKHLYERLIDIRYRQGRTE